MGGLAQLLLAGLALLLRVKSYIFLRAHQLTPEAAGSNEPGQAIMVGVVLEYLLRPISLLLIYLAIEGAVRFVGGLITGEIIPSLIVSLLLQEL